MKITIEFNLPDESHEHEMFLQSPNMHSTLWDFKQYLRSEIKYGEHDDQEYEMLEKIREKFFEIMESHKCIIE